MKQIPWSAALLVLLPLGGAAAETLATPDLPPLPMVAAAINASNSIAETFDHLLPLSFS